MTHGLNCKPGDLALVLEDITTACPDCGCAGKVKTRDKIVKVTTIDNLTSLLAGYVIWNLADCISFEIEFACGAGVAGKVAGLADRILRPIRDTPGDDETLTWERPQASKKMKLIHVGNPFKLPKEEKVS